MHFLSSTTQNRLTICQTTRIQDFLHIRPPFWILSHWTLTPAPNQKTAFVISGMGKYQFNRVLFGLAQAPAHFQKLINKVLTDCNFAMGYLDDIIIFSKTEEEHLEHLETIFN